MKKLISIFLIIAMFTVSAGSALAASAEKENDKLSSQIAMNISKVQSVFPEAKIDSKKIASLLENAKKGILPDSMKGDSKPVKTYIKKTADGVTHKLNVYADSSFEDWGIIYGTASYQGTYADYTNTDVYYINLWYILEFYVSHRDYYDDSSQNYIISLGSLAATVWMQPISSGYNSQYAWYNANFLDVETCEPISGLTLTFNAIALQAYRDMGPMF